MMCNFCGAIHTNNVECHIGDLKDTAIERFHELERLRTHLSGHTDQAVEDTLSDLMTKYDALAKENVALRMKLSELLIPEAIPDSSPQVAKIEAVLEAAEKYESCLELSAEGRPLDDYDRDCAALSVARAVRNLRGDK